MEARIAGSSAIGVWAGRVSIRNPEKTAHALNHLPFFAQLCPLRAVVSARHLAFAYEQSISAFEKRTSLLKDMHLEFLLRLTGERQVGRALDKAELRRGTSKSVLVVAAENREGLMRNFRVAGDALLKAGSEFFACGRIPRAGQGEENAAIERTALLGLEG